MVVQCEACQTRFRLADEKIKPGGTKVRCSKCKQIFTVSPQAPEPEPEVAATEDSAMQDEGGFPEPTAPAEDVTTSASEPEDDTFRADSPEVDFNGLEQDMGDSDTSGDELAEDFSFADTSQPPTADDFADSSTQEEVGLPFDEPTDAAPERADETSGTAEFSFDEEEESSSIPMAAGEDLDLASADEAFESNDFSLETTEEQDTPGELSFGEEDDNSFSFDDSGEESDNAELPALDTGESTGPTEFSFDDDDDDAFADDSTDSEWGDPASDDGDSFDFEEPQFDNDTANEESGNDSSLQFGEIDFSDDEGEPPSPSFDGDDDFSQATMQQEEEPAPEPDYNPEPQREAPPARDYTDDQPAPPPQQKSKGPLARILVLLLLLLVILAGAAGYLYMQNGSISLYQVAEYLPFLQEYIGEDPGAEQAPRIGIKVSGSAYVNGKAGQLLVLQGEAVNNYATARSAITIKGVLLDKQGKSIMQQTVSCGNYMDNESLETLTFTEIEEAMNNQFGETLSNMNVAAGAAIPFTIVFRNLPEEIANINVEVVDSIPGN